MRDEEVDWALQAWKVTVEVQQHFNDIELRIRNYALTLLVAVLGAAGLALREGTAVQVLGWTTSLATILFVVGVVGWGAFYFVDRIWYHRLLLGAVKHGVAIETALSGRVPGIGLTQSIGAASPYKFWKWELHSDDKIRFFYSVIAALLFAFALLAHFTDVRNPDPVIRSCESSATAFTCDSEEGSFTCSSAETTLRCRVRGG